MPFQSQTWPAKDVSFGAAHKLPEFLVNDLVNFENLSAAGAQPKVADAKPNGDGFYIGANPASPAIGDLRISFSVVKPGPASLIAAQAGNSFKPWKSPKTGVDKYKIVAGTHTQADIIQMMMTEAKMLMWILRVVGFLVMAFGLILLTKPLSVAADILPFVGNIVGAGLGLICFVTAAILSLVTIVIAWIAHRPVIAIVLLVIVVGLCVLLVNAMSKGKKKRLAGLPADMPPPPPPVPAA